MMSRRDVTGMKLITGTEKEIKCHVNPISSSTAQFTGLRGPPRHRPPFQIQLSPVGQPGDTSNTMLQFKYWRVITGRYKISNNITFFFVMLKKIR